MEFDIRNHYGKYKSVSLAHDNIRIDFGILDEKEYTELSGTLFQAATELGHPISNQLEKMDDMITNLKECIVELQEQLYTLRDTYGV